MHDDYRIITGTLSELEVIDWVDVIDEHGISPQSDHHISTIKDN